eukprot:TRINITY_DN688_c1_g1_i1.p1 TRINITY_DN688_c1_g1~~TRINITY_DN688_c1_g1_i1.p1  ORF type:complete len:613 (+),score=123.15 TRINITY_DN688_c1_g1_i1:71-1909(+)
MKRFLILSLAVCCLCFVAAEDASTSGIQIREVARLIDLTSQVAKHSISINAANIGSKFVSTFALSLLDYEAATLSLFKVSDASGQPLKLVGKKDRVHGDYKYTEYTFDLGRYIAPQDSFGLLVALYFTNTMTPDPFEIKQGDNLLVRYNSNHMLFSPYEILNQKTDVRFATSTVKDYTQLDPSVLKGNTLTYGPYADMDRFSVSKFELHFENNGPFIRASKLTRVVKISHFGSIEVSDNYQLEHTGGKLTGPFSRGEYSRKRQDNPTAFRGFRQVLPLKVFNVWFRDEIGNITSSAIQLPEEEDAGFFTVQLAPRFPLFGGWKTEFNFGYSLFSEDYLRSSLADPNFFFFNSTLFNYFDTDIAVDELEIRVILPSGASNGAVVTDDDVSVTYDVAKSYLDFVGREVVVISKKNFLREHSGEYFQVSYNFNCWTGLFQKPLILVLAYVTAFIGAIFYFKTVSSDEEEEEESVREEFAELLGELKEQHELLCDYFANMLQVTVKYAKSKKSKLKGGQDAIKKLISETQTEMLKIKTGIESVDDEAGAVARGLIRKEHIKYGFLKQLIGNEIRYRNKDIVKEVYETKKAQTQSNYNAVDEELDRLVADLTEMANK